MKTKVLIVDDSALIRSVMSAGLPSEGSAGVMRTSFGSYGA